jgi:hypothetical protein
MCWEASVKRYEIINIYLQGYNLNIKAFELSPFQKWYNFIVRTLFFSGIVTIFLFITCLIFC